MRSSSVFVLVAIASGCQAIAGIEDVRERTNSGGSGGSDGDAMASTGGTGTGGMGAGGAGGAATGGATGSGGATTSPEAEACILNSDCEPGLVCIFATCSVACRADADCSPGYRCLDTVLGAACVEASSSTCDRTCPGGTVCVDGLCRTPCVPSPVPDAGGVDAAADAAIEAGAKDGGLDAGAKDASTDDGSVEAGPGTATDASTGCRADQICVNGGCVGINEPSLEGGAGGPDGGPCSANDKACSGSIPLTCDATGQWQEGAAWPYLCAAGECTGVCKPGDQQCGGAESNVPQTCSASGTWTSGSTCPYQCADGLCTGVCEPGTQRCNGNTPQTCSDSGSWVSSPACNASTSQCDPVLFVCKKFDGQSCSVKQDCVSNFCKDGYCCDTACTGSCQSCGVDGSEGTCSPVLLAQDADSCSGTSMCSGAGQCKLADGEQCTVTSDCANNNCTTFYPDADGDGYGSNSSSVRLCTTTAPDGYKTNASDCCDSDAESYPNAVTGGAYVNATWTPGWHEFANNCGSFDWDCNGGTQMGNYYGYPACNANCSGGNCLDSPTCGVYSPLKEYYNGGCIDSGGSALTSCK